MNNQRAYRPQKPAALVTVLIVLVMLLSSGCSGLLPGRSTAAAATLQSTSFQTSAPAVAPRLASSAVGATLVEQQELLANLYDQVLPSVVNIQVTKRSAVSQLPDSFPFGPQTPQPNQGEGSGWVYDSAGHVITNNHVVEDADEVTVIFYNGTWADATVVATDPQADLAVLRVETPNGLTLQPLPLAQPHSLRVGYSVIAIGSPFGNDRTMTFGIVSALGRSFPVGENASVRYTLPDVIQTDAAINPGNSGGPLMNLDGEVVGVNFAINSPVRANSGIGFAIPVAIVQRVVPALIEQGAYPYPYLGISGQSITPRVAKELNLANNVLGARVSSVLADGPSGQAGVREGDIIVGLSDLPIYNFDDLVATLVTRTAVGDTVILRVLRGEAEEEIAVTLAARPSTTARRAASPDQPGATISASEAIAIAREAVLKAELMERVTDTSASSAQREGRTVWVVEMQDGAGKMATVVVDGASGDVMEISVRSR